jgi:murE/murF fusion protein
MGSFNVSNALAAAATALALDMPLADVVARLAASPQVPGRMERLADAPMVVLRDYAHTPDAMTRVLATLRPLTPGRLVLVFGCGGYRDRAKRPEMARIAVEGADLVAITTDNPRTEDPERIMDDMESGMGGAHHLRISDREEAIHRVLAETGPGDTVLLAGKGHETYQIIGKTKHHFDERTIVRAAIEGRRELDELEHPAALGLPALRCRAVRVGVSTDTRSLPAGALFVAIAGERFDGHAHLEEAAARGALGAVVRAGTPAVPGLELFEVPDTVVALGWLARARRREIGGPVVAVTGTNGKTSTKEMLALTLGTRFRVHATRANLNNLIGVPLTILEARPTRRRWSSGGGQRPGEIAGTGRSSADGDQRRGGAPGRIRVAGGRPAEKLAGESAPLTVGTDP